MCTMYWGPCPKGQGGEYGVKVVDLARGKLFMGSATFSFYPFF